MQILICSFLAVQAAVLGASAVFLPYRFGLFSFICAAGAVTATVAAGAGFVGWKRWPRVWRLQSFGALALLIYFTYVAVFSAAHVAGLYQGLGPGVAAGLLAIWALPLLLLLPTSLWGVLATPGQIGTGMKSLWVVAFAVPALGAAMAHAQAPGRLVSQAPPQSTWTAQLARIGTLVPTLAEAAGPPAAMFVPSPTSCPTAPSTQPNGQTTLIATFLDRASNTPRSLCFQGAATTVVQELYEHLASGAARAAVKVDVITAFANLEQTPDLALPFAVRPGLDGVCSQTQCLMPWQLIALDQFGSYRPLPFIEHLRLGVDLTQLAGKLGAPPDQPLFRIATHDFVISAKGQVQPKRRLRDRLPPLTPENVARASKRAERYIIAAQRPDGRFAYEVNPFTGAGDTEGFSLARQAATTMVLCDLGDGEHPTTTLAAERSLALLAQLQRTTGAGSVVVFPPGYGSASAGHVALALAAFIKCRPLVPMHDALINSLGRFLLALQSPSGRFHHFYDVNAAAPMKNRYSLYIDGEVIYALALFEDLVARTPQASWPALADIHQTVERAMDYFGNEYWDHPAADLFGLEENWHCTAARAALQHHQHKAYERFCIDFARFKTRAVFAKRHGGDPQFLGAYGFGNVTVPMNTPTAGFGETAAGALTVLKHRGQPFDWLAEPLQNALRFLLMAQWTEDNCFACTPHVTVVGGFSKSLAEPAVRIDYVQHAWTALGYGAQALALKTSL